MSGEQGSGKGAWGPGGGGAGETARVRRADIRACRGKEKGVQPEVESRGEEGARGGRA